jgi:hypothetical protein
LASHPANKAEMLAAMLPAARDCLPLAEASVAKGLLQVLALLAGESYALAAKAEQDTALMREVAQLLLTSADESLVRKCLRLYLSMAAAGAAPTSAGELHRLQEAKRFALSAKSDKLIQKLQQLLLSPGPQKRPASFEVNWDEVNQIRRATKGCIGIMKDKINAQFEKRPEFEMSFGLAKDEDSPAQ